MYVNKINEYMYNVHSLFRKVITLFEIWNLEKNIFLILKSYENV